MNNKGFTLIEALIVLAIISILSLISIGYINSENDRIKSDSIKLYSLLNRARSDAVKGNCKIFVGINENNISLYKNEILYKVGKLDYYNISSSNFNEGYLGGSDMPKIIPDEIRVSCNDNFHNCAAYENWVNSFKPIRYDYVFSYNQMGLISNEGQFLLKDKNNSKYVRKIEISSFGIVKIVY